MDGGNDYLLEDYEPTRSTGWRRKVADLAGRVGALLALGCVLAVFDVLLMLGRRVWNGAWSFYSFGEALGNVNLRLEHDVADWPASVIWILLTLTVLGIAQDLDKPAPARTPAAPTQQKECKPLRLPRSLWPRTPHSETTVLVRLGRAFHWLSIAIACVALFIGAAIGWESVGNAARTAEAARLWDLSHPDGQPKPGVYYDGRPYVSESFLGAALLGGFATAFGIALTGRGVRYILAGE